MQQESLAAALHKELKEEQMRPRWIGKCFQSLIKHCSNAVTFSDNWEATALLGIVADFENKIWSMNANTLRRAHRSSRKKST